MVSDISNIVARGIDISSWQGQVNFSKVKSGEYSFVIIKAGEGTKEMSSFKTDEKYQYLQKALAAGLDWGAYWWSNAVTIEEAKQEAKAFLKAVYGLKPTYPLYLDQEYGTPPDRLGMSNSARQLRTDIVKAFLDALQDAGYYAGLYSSTDWLKTRLYDDQLTAYDKWVAQYASNCTYTGSYGVWQHTVLGTIGTRGKDYFTYGKVPGVEANCDLNICYKDYPSIIKAAGLNSWSNVTPESQNWESKYKQIAADYATLQSDYETLALGLQALTSKIRT